MHRKILGFAFIAITTACLWSQDQASVKFAHQTADSDGVYYVGPEVTAPSIIRTVSVPYPDGLPLKSIQGMTVMAMVVNEKGIATHVQLLHKHGDAFDRAALAAVKVTKFEPGTLLGKPVPVWIDVRVVFRASRSEAVPEVLITERDLPSPDESSLQDKHHKPLAYTAPIPIHTVDADFVDPFSRHPYIQVAIVTVEVSETGVPKDVRVVRGLGFGLDEKAAAAVWRYKFIPATKHGKPVAAGRNIMVDFVKF